jgi:hypothetical protein
MQTYADAGASSVGDVHLLQADVPPYLQVTEVKLVVKLAVKLVVKLAVQLAVKLSLEVSPG